MTEDSGGRRTIAVEGISRVEGEGSLRVDVRDGVVDGVALTIFEPPRFFEALLRGRQSTESPDITARICGICPVAYQMSACAAVEDACGATVGEPISALRRLLYCGEWIQSHALHINQLMETIGGRSIHPVNVKVGGFYRAPARDRVAALAEPLHLALDAALATVEWVSGFDFPEVEGDYRFVALRSPGRYPIESGRIASSDGLDVSPAEFADLVIEEHVARSTALQARIEGRLDYLTGPLARYALNASELPDIARHAATRAGLGAVCVNPFQSIIVRAVELVFACHEALRLVEAYEPPEPAAVAVPPRAGVGTGATEAPRGLLFHRYELDQDGVIVAARIVPPTSQNLITIESDLRRVAQDGLALPDDELTWRCEQAVRNHDPCISCATHFLDVTVVRR